MAPLAGMDPFGQHLQGMRQPQAPLRRLLEQVIGQPKRGLLPDAREFGQLVVRSSMALTTDETGDVGRGRREATSSKSEA